MGRKLSRSAIARKAWKTRKANASLGKRLIAGTKEAREIIKDNDGVKIGSQFKLILPDDYNIKIPTLCQQLDDTITNFENRIRTAIARINSLM